MAESQRPPTLFSAIRDLERLRQIIGVLARHGFGELIGRTSFSTFLSGKNLDTPQHTVAERVRMVIEELGPSFIKLGQIMSTRSDLVPADVLIELKKLQDQVPPVPIDGIKQTIEDELGHGVGELFESFDDVPLASASVAQVHRAKLKIESGDVVDVVLKVQRPGIRAVVERDLELLHLLAQGIERSVPDAKFYSPVKLVNEFDRAITAELDFTLEAEHAARFARNFDGSTTIRFPSVYRKWSSRKVLTLEFFDGQKIYDAVKHGFDPHEITRITLAAVLKAVFEDGFFHADPHPGNVILMGTPEAPVIGLIDLGLVGRLTPALRDATVDLLSSAVREDYRGMADALYAIGTPTRKIERRAFEADVLQLSQKYLGRQLKEIEVSALIRDLVGGASKYGLEIPSDFVLVGKALMTLEGIGREIAPDFDLFSEMKPHIVKLMAQRYSPDRLASDFFRTASKVSSLTADLPHQIQEIIDDLRRGKLETQHRAPSLEVVLDMVGRRLFSGLVLGSAIIATSYLWVQNETRGALLLASVSTLWAFGHWIVLFWNGRKRRGSRS